jgi:predicted transposase YbfD/YdcC
MAVAQETSISRCFADLPDPRLERTRVQQLVDIITIALCAVLCGADDWVAVEAFGRAKEGWLRRFLALPGGIPSHDTFGRVFARLDPIAFGRGFEKWVQRVAPQTLGQVAIDGKTLRRSHDQWKGQDALHLVSAWAKESGLVLGQVAIEADSNEITAIPRLLDLLALEGTIVSIDAIGCQTAIAEQIVAGGADYVLALKANQGRLYEEVRRNFAVVRHPQLAHLVAHQTGRTVEKDHGRLEVRQIWSTSDPRVLADCAAVGDWPKLRSVVMVRAQRRVGEKVRVKSRYYISSLAPDPLTLGEAIRSHWGIENRLHWILDVTFREDQCRTRTGHSAQNLALLRKFALNLLRQDPTKGSIATKRFTAALDERYLTRLLACF